MPKSNSRAYWRCREQPLVVVQCLGWRCAQGRGSTYLELVMLADPWMVSTHPYLIASFPLLAWRHQRPLQWLNFRIGPAAVHVRRDFAAQFRCPDLLLARIIRTPPAVAPTHRGSSLTTPTSLAVADRSSIEQVDTVACNPAQRPSQWHLIRAEP